MIVMQSALSLAQHTKRSMKKKHTTERKATQSLVQKRNGSKNQEKQAEYKSKSATKGDVNNDVVDDDRRNESKIAYFVENYSRRIL